MSESVIPAQIPKLQQKTADSTPAVSPVKVRFECTQCGHLEEEFAKPAPARMV
jgi:hypothetical protein